MHGKLGLLIKTREGLARSIVENYLPTLKAKEEIPELGVSGEGTANLATGETNISSTAKVDRKTSGEVAERMQIREHNRDPKVDAANLEVEEIFKGFRAIITRLNLNYDTIMRHAGLGGKIKLKDKGNSIAATSAYGKLIELISLLEKPSPAEIEQILAEVEKTLRILREELEENAAVRADLSRSLAIYRENSDKIHNEIENIKYYRDKLLPSFIHRIYETRASEVLGAWDDRVRELGLEEAVKTLKTRV